MSEGSDKAGFAVSAAMHLALLGMLVFGFAAAPKFDDATESVPVDTITQNQFNEIMQGEKSAKPAPAPVQPPPRPQAAAEPPPPPTPPEPPPELKRVDDTPTPPTPPPPPPPTPEPPPPPPPPKPAPPPPPPKPQAEETPAPPVKPKILETPPERPKDPPKEKFKPDELAKLLAKEKSTEPAAKAPAAAPSTKSFDPKAIDKLLGQTKTADAAPTGRTAQGLPNQHAQHMSPSLSAALDSWLKDAYMSCWSPPPTVPEGEPYVPAVHIEFNQDGSLNGRPVLVNPPSDPAWRAHAESAMRAVLKCNPMKIPPEYAPFFEQWRAKTIHFDPRDALG